MAIILSNDKDSLYVHETETQLILMHHKEVIISTAGKSNEDKKIIINAMRTIEGNHKKLGINYEHPL